MSNSSPATLQAEAMKDLAVKALEALKAIDIVVLDVRGRASFTDTMIFASGNSTRHVISIADAVIEATKAANLPPLGVEGETVGEWVLVDLGDIVVHVMLPDTREFYELEKLWSEQPTDTTEEQS